MTGTVTTIRPGCRARNAEQILIELGNAIDALDALPTDCLAELSLSLQGSGERVSVVEGLDLVARQVRIVQTRLLNHLAATAMG